MRIKNTLWFVISLLALALVAQQINIYFSPTLSNAKLIFYDAGQPSGETALSGTYESVSTANTRATTLAFDIKAGALRKAAVWFVVDDCVDDLQVNGIPMDITFISREKRCDINNGFTIDLGPSLQSGINHVRVGVSDIGGNFKVSVRPLAFTQVSMDALFVAALLIPLIVLWQWQFLRPSVMGYGRVSVLFSIVFYSAAALFLYRYLLATPEENVHDVHSHMEYVNYLIAHLSLPKATQCYECYQPPGYYILAAAAYRLGEMVGLTQPMMAIKALSVPIYLGLISGGVALLKTVRLRPLFALFGFALFVFWPLGAVKATDFSADILVACGVLWSFLWTLKWYATPRTTFAFKALIIAALAMWVKSTAIVSFAMFGAATLLLLYERRLTLKALLSGYMLTTIVGCLIVGLSYLAYLSTVPTGDPNSSAMVFYTVSQYPALWFADDTLAYYLTFPLETYLSEPFLNPYSDALGRKYFWSAFLKIALHGGWDWHARKVAIGLNFTLLLMVLYSLASTAAILLRKQPLISRPLLLHGLMMGLLLVMLIAFRVQQPAVCNQDIRYIYAIIPLCCFGYAVLVQDHVESGKVWRGFIGGLLGLTFMGLSIALIVIQYADRWI